MAAAEGNGENSNTVKEESSEDRMQTKHRRQGSAGTLALEPWGTEATISRGELWSNVSFWWWGEQSVLELWPPRLYEVGTIITAALRNFGILVEGLESFARGHKDSR